MINPKPAPVPARPLRILVVDDEPTVCEVLSIYFAEDGHDVSTAADGVEALELFKAGTWDIVVTDRMMPRMTGDELARELRRIAPTTPIILVTGYTDVQATAPGERPLFDRIIAKPFTRQILREAIFAAAQVKLAA
jgi:CheY-like chemotaxis protein